VLCGDDKDLLKADKKEWRTPISMRECLREKVGFNNGKEIKFMT
jgi:hypothetical protein